MRVESAIDRAPARLAPPSVLGDARLVRLAARGDEAAFAQIFRRYHQPLYRYCRAITGNSEEAADALQNTMLKVMRSLPGERRQIELKPWLFRVAHNEAVSLLRARRPHAELEEGDGRTVAGPEAGIAAREDLRELMADLEELPERQRATVILRELNGLSFAEIASVFATSTAAAKQAAYDGRTALQDYAKGRAMNCDAAMRAISDRDGKLGTSRKLRGHLRGCEACASFKAALDQRSGQLAAIAPALPATAAAAVMQKLFGGGGSLGGGSAGGGSVGLAAAGTKLAAGGAALKGTAAVVAAAVAASAAVGGTQLAGNERARDSKSQRSGPAAAAGAQADSRKISIPAAERRGGARGAVTREPVDAPDGAQGKDEERPDLPDAAGAPAAGGPAIPAGARGLAPTRRGAVADERRREASARRPETGTGAPRGERPNTPTAGAPSLPERPATPELPDARPPQGTELPPSALAPTPPQISSRPGG